MASDKIFVDLDEEIIFTVEKVLKAASERVIVVIPESANLVASLISLKLLSSQIAKSPKSIVVVTEDQLGLSLAKKSGLVATRKISEITPSVWTEAENRKKEFLKSREARKAELVSSRVETDKYSIIDEESEKITPKIQEGVSDSEDEGDNPESIEESSEDSEEKIEYTPALAEKPRLDPKVINLGTITVLAGGDIEQNSGLHNEILGIKEPQPIEKLEKSQIEDQSFKQIETAESDQESLQDHESISRKSTLESNSNQVKNLIGRDLSAIVPETGRSRRRSIPQDFEAAKREKSVPKSGFSDHITQFRSKISAFYNTGNKKVKIGVTIFIVVVLMFLLVSSAMGSASVTVYVDKQNVAVSETLKGEIDGNTVDSENLTVPIYPIKVKAESSNTADTTGQAQDGNKAQGLVTIYNKQTQEISLKSGTVLESISTGLKYKLTSDTVVPAATEEEVGGEVNLLIGVKKDVAIQAESFGENYNTEGSASFRFVDYSTDELTAKSFTSIEGGDTTDESAVSDGDIQDLKDGLVDELKNRLTDQIENSIAEEEILLSNSISFSELDSSSDKEVGEVAPSVTVTVELEATAYFVKQADLKTIAAKIISSQSDFEGEVDAEELEDLVPSNVVIDGEEVSFQISTEGDVVAGFTEEELAYLLENKSIGEAKRYLDEAEGVSEYKLSVGSSLVPEFFKNLPDAEKIDVRIEVND